MQGWIVKHAVGALTLLAIGCSGHDILLTTANAGSGNGGGSGAGTGGNFQEQGSGGSPNPAAMSDAGAPSEAAGSAGTAPGSDLPPVRGWVAYDSDLFAEGQPGRHIQLIAADGSCKRALTEGAEIEKQPAFSADGKRIAFAANGTGTFQIYAMDLANGDRTQLTNVPEGATYPSWSPDGKTIAFVAGDAEDDGNASNRVMRVDTETLETSAITNVRRPPFTWSAFAANDLVLVGNEYNLIGIDIVTLDQYDVVPFNGRIPNPSSPSIGPDGTHYAFSDYCGEKKTLFIARTDGKTGDTCANALHLAPYVDGLISASWGPTGYIASETKQHDIVLVASDGSVDVRVLVDSNAPARNPVFAPASADLSCED